jgi:catecholate siderophore receptor
MANQTDLTFHFNTGAIEHSLVVGVSVSHEGYSQITGGEYRNADGSTYLLDPEDLYAPDHIFNQPLNLTVAAFANSTVDDQAGYVFDTLKFGEHWLFGAGARYEHNKADYSVYTRTPTAGLGIGPGAFVVGVTNPLVSDDDLLSYRASLVYKPVEDGSVYAAFGNSKLPATASVDGSCGTSCEQAPQIAKTYELGVKWDFLNSQLGFTGAVFRTDRTNYLVASGDPNVPEQELDGRARVDGVQVGLAGNITRDWSISANYAHLRSEVLQSVSAYTLATTGIDAQAGNALANTPRDSANLWTTYKILPPFTIGYGVNYTSWVNATAADATPTAIYNRATIPGFVLHNLMGSYTFSKKLNLQLNITNLFDKEYFTQLRTVSTTSGWVSPGAGRTAFLTLNVSF